MHPSRKPAGRTFRLLPYFSVASAVTITAATLILAVVYGEIARRNFLATATGQSVAMSRVLSNNLWRHQHSTIALLSRLDAEVLRRHPEMLVLRQAVIDATHDLPVRKIKLYDLDGDVLFSTDSAEIGSSQANNDGIITALRGEVSSKLIERDEEDERSHDYVDSNHDIVESYIPIRPRGGDGPIEGVFEVYYDVTTFIEGLKRAQLFAAAAVAATLLALYGILYLVVMRADSILRRQHESNLRLSEAIEYADSGVMITGARGPAAPLLYKNRALDEIHGDTIASARDLLGESGESAFQSLVGQLKAGDAVQTEFSHVDAGQTRRWLQVRGNAVFGDRGEVVRLVWVVNDITQRRTAEEAMSASENKYRQLMETANDAIVVADAETGVIIDANSRAAELTGRPIEQLIGMHQTGLHPNTERETFARLFRVQAVSPSGAVQELPVCRADGSQVPVEVSASTFELQGRKVVQGLFRDISERKQTERDLQLTRFSVDNASDALFWVRPDGSFFYINESACTSLGRSREEFLAMSVWEITADMSPEDWPRRWAELKAAGGASFESCHRRRDGTVFPVDVNVTYLEFQDQEFLLAFARDITERKAAEDKLYKVDQDLRTISACNQALVRASGEPELLGEICRILVDVGKQSFAAVAYVAPDAEGGVRQVASYSNGRTLPESVRDRWHAIEMRLLGEAIASGTAAVVHDVLDELAWPPGAPELCCRSIVILPLKPADGPAFGVLTVYAERGELYEDEGRGLVTELANDLAYGVLARRAAAERALAEESLRKLSRAVEQSGSLVIITDTDGHIEYVNPKFVEVTGYEPGEVIGGNPNVLKSGETEDERYAELWNDIRAGRDWRGTFHNRRKDGTLFWVVASISPIRAVDGTVTHFVGIEEDITERVEQEIRLRQTEKMEALGNLAGGIAHDLNNMLLPILALSEMTADELPAGSDQEHRIRRVIQAAERSRSLVQRILSFSHQNEPTWDPLELRTVVEDYLGLLKTTLPSSIRIEAELDQDIGRIVGDAAQIGNVLLNLGSNASDAMGDQPGELAISLSRVELAAAEAGAAGAKAGAYAKLTVTDTGHGMTQDIVERIFDPFFTTKPVGKGTGLGLSVVYGVITSHGGAISVHSTPGIGTTFEILLPLAPETGEAGGDEDSQPASALA